MVIPRRWLARCPIVLGVLLSTGLLSGIPLQPSTAGARASADAAGRASVDAAGLDGVDAAAQDGVAPADRLRVDAAAPPRLAAWYPLDGFEAPDWPDPGLWGAPSEPALTWRPSTCQAKWGSRALRAFAGPRGAAELPCDAVVAPATVSMVTMVLDLRAAEAASRIDLFFDLWMRLSPGQDTGLFIYLRLPQPDGTVRRVPIFGATGDTGQWTFPARRLDLMNLDDVSQPGLPIDLRGGRWDLDWVARAGGGAPAGGGVFIDNVVLVWEPDPAIPTPTPRATATATLLPPTATEEPTPTLRPSATPTATPSPSPQPTGRQAFLPSLQLDGVVAPTPTPSPEPGGWRIFLPSLQHDGPFPPTPTATSTVDATATEEATATLDVTDTPSATDPPTATVTGTPEPQAGGSTRTGAAR